MKILSEAGIEKDEAIIPARLREALKEEKLRSEEYQRVAKEARRSMDLCLAETNRHTEEIFEQKTMLRDGAMLLRRAETALDDHMDACPHRAAIVSSRQGECWHFPECHVVDQMSDRNRQALRCCAYCGDRRSPLDVMSPVLSGTLRTEIQAWFTEVNRMAG